MKVPKKDSRLWHIAKKYCPKRIGSPIELKPIKLSDDGMYVTILVGYQQKEVVFNMSQLVKFLGVPSNGRYEFQNLPHKGE